MWILGFEKRKSEKPFGGNGTEQCELGEVGNSPSGEMGRREGEVVSWTEARKVAARQVRGFSCDEWTFLFDVSDATWSFNAMQCFHPFTFAKFERSVTISGDLVQGDWVEERYYFAYSSTHVSCCDDFRPWLKNGIFKCFSWLNGSLLGPPHHLLLDSAPNLGPLISRWELDKFKDCWNKSFRTSKILTLLYLQFSNFLISQRDMSGLKLGTLSNNRLSGGGGVIWKRKSRPI